MYPNSFFNKYVSFSSVERGAHRVNYELGVLQDYYEVRFRIHREHMVF